MTNMPPFLEALKAYGRIPQVEDKILAGTSLQTEGKSHYIQEMVPVPCLICEGRVGKR